MSGTLPEPDEEPDSETAATPDGLSLYLTPAGLSRMRAELQFLQREERPRIVEIVSWAAGNGDRSENGDYLYGKKRLREIDRRLRFLGRRIEHARIVDPALQTRRDRVFFGATVSLLDESGEGRTVRIVGVDEPEHESEVSLASPLARALLGRGLGDEVTVRTPRGAALARIIGIVYPSLPDGEPHAT